MFQMMVVFAEFEREMIRERVNAGLSAASDGQVALLRRVAKALGSDAFQHQQWWQAQQAAEGIPTEPFTDCEEEARLEALASDWADRLAKAFSTKLSQNPEVAARVLSHYFGRNLKQLVRHLSEQVSFDEADEDDTPDF